MLRRVLLGAFAALCVTNASAFSFQDMQGGNMGGPGSSGRGKSSSPTSTTATPTTTTATPTTTTATPTTTTATPATTTTTPATTTSSSSATSSSTNATTVTSTATTTTSSSSGLVLGHDLSSVSLMESDESASWYTSDGTESTIEAILGAGGMQSVRLRLWTSGSYDTDYTLALAQRFYKAGYSIYLDMHFSDTWADADSQAVPTSWDDTSVTTLAADLRSYVSDTLATFTAGGVEIAILSLGNEITDGMLFPTGQISDDDFSDFATLWAAARAGVTDAVAAGTTQPKVMIHLDNGWKEATLTWFFDGLFATGTVSKSDVDVIGVSFYPFYSTSATLSALATSLDTLATSYGLPIYVAETDWPNSCSGVDLSADYAVSAEGQIEWTQAVMDTVSAVTGGLGAGVYYWEPGYLSVASLGSSCTSALLFDVDWSDSSSTKATALASTALFTSS